MNTRGIVIWILLLSGVAVGLRNFERGMSSDAPLYSTIARNIVQQNNWLDLESGIDEFHPYVEHPHLGYWILAAVFKVLPIDDWSARIPGIVFYALTLSLLFFFIRRRHSERAALWTVLLLWTWSRYSNFFSNVYLDPGCVFFGVLSVVLVETGWVTAAGVALALSLLTKGIAAAGFFPALAWVFFENVKKARVAQAGKFVLAASIPLVLYWLALRSTHTPHWIALYWERQMTNRFLGLIPITTIIFW